MLTDIKPLEHFKDLVSTAIKHQNVKTNPIAEFYLSSLLASFLTSNRLTQEPLAITYLKALGESREVQARMLVELGDISLFTSGFFSDSLKRKIVDLDYYMAMGVTSYSYVADLHKKDKSHNSVSALYCELAAKFGSFVDVLTEVSERSRLTSSKDVLRIYERWLRTKSKQAESLLRGLGIEPHKVSTKPVH